MVDWFCSKRVLTWLGVGKIHGIMDIHLRSHALQTFLQCLTWSRFGVNHIAESIPKIPSAPQTQHGTL